MTPNDSWRLTATSNFSVLRSTLGSCEALCNGMSKTSNTPQIIFLCIDRLIVRDLIGVRQHPSVIFTGIEALDPLRKGSHGQCNKLAQAISPSINMFISARPLSVCSCYYCALVV